MTGVQTCALPILSVLTGNEYREEAARKIDDAYTKEAQKKANTWAWVFGKKEERKDGEK